MEPSSLPLLQLKTPQSLVHPFIQQTSLLRHRPAGRGSGPRLAKCPASPTLRPLSHTPPASWSRFPWKGQRPLCPLPSHRPWGVPCRRGEAGCLSSVRLLCGEVSSPWCLLCGVHGPLPGGRVPGGWRTEVEKKTPLDQPGGGQSVREGGEVQRTDCLCGQVGGGGQGPGTGQWRRPLALRPAVWSLALHPLRMDCLV